MDIVEHNLNKFRELQADADKRKQDIYSNTIMKIANVSINCSINLDTAFNKYFPELETLGKKDDAPFNPSYCYEVNTNNGDYEIINRIQRWDTAIGILPNRIVMGSYYIAETSNLNKFDITCQNCELSHKSVKHIPCKSCGHNNVITNISIDTKDIIYKPDKSKINEMQTFEIDNYLNIYHPPSKMYLILNKVAFPKLPFYIKGERVDSHGNYHRIFATYLTDTIGSWYRWLSDGCYNSKDKEQELFKMLKNIIPPDYATVYEYYDRFRKFQQYSLKQPQKNIDVIPPIVNDTDTNEQSSQDAKETIEEGIIKGLQNQITAATKIADTYATYIETLKDEYANQQMKLTDANYEIARLRSKLVAETAKNANIEREYEAAQRNATHEAAAKLQTELSAQDGLHQQAIIACEAKFTAEIEKIRQELFNAKAQLATAETYKARFAALGVDIATTEEKLAAMEAKYNKTVGLRDNLITQLTAEKEATHNGKMLAKEYETKISMLNQQINEAKYEAARQITEIKGHIAENNKLKKIIESHATASSNAFENALSDKLVDMEKKCADLIAENNKLTDANKKINLKLQKYETSIKTIFNIN